MKKKLYQKLISAAAALAVSASVMIQPICASASFTDVPDNYSYKKAITTLSKLQRRVMSHRSAESVLCGREKER